MAREVEKTKQCKKYRTDSHKMILREGFSLDNVQELLSRIDGEGA